MIQDDYSAPEPGFNRVENLREKKREYYKLYVESQKEMVMEKVSKKELDGINGKLGKLKRDYSVLENKIRISKEKEEVQKNKMRALMDEKVKLKINAEGEIKV